MRLLLDPEAKDFRIRIDTVLFYEGLKRNFLSFFGILVLGVWNTSH